MFYGKQIVRGASSTAALGVVLRALGQGLRVHIAYFMKGDYPYGEQNILSQLSHVSFSRVGFRSFIDPSDLIRGYWPGEGSTIKDRRRSLRMALAV